MPGTNERFLLNASWLIKLRWVAVIGQLLTIAAVRLVFQIEIKMWWALLIVIGLTAFSNGLFNFIFERYVKDQQQAVAPWDILLGLLMLMDILSLTTLLFASGGPTNPFALFFFVNLSLSAVVLRGGWAWSLNFLAIICFVFLLVYHHEIPQLSLGIRMIPVSESQEFSIPQLGLMVSFATCSSVIVYFMTRLTAELRQQEVDLRNAQQRQSRAEKLEALGTLAAGAAHELATPLSTIAVISGDVEAILQETPKPQNPREQELVDDIRLIRSELNRCRKILDSMATDSGQAIGESIKAVTVKELWIEVLDGLPNSTDVEFRPETGSLKRSFAAPRTGLARSIRGIIQNAIDASQAGQPIAVSVRSANGSQKLVWVITDQGTGISAADLARINEPFFTTKQPGQGMGLGVFLAESIISRIGGKMSIESELGVGTTVTIELPFANESATVQTQD